MSATDPNFDAMTATEADFKAAVARMAREHAKRQVAAEQAGFLEKLRRKYADPASADPDGDTNVDAMQMTETEWHAALRRLR